MRVISTLQLKSLLLLAAALTMMLASTVANCQAWDAVQYFQYNIESVSVQADAAGKPVVVVDFSVTNPVTGTAWNVKTDYPFTQSPSLSRLAIDIGWNAVEYQNTGASGESLAPLLFGTGLGAALPISINAIKASTSLGGNLFRAISSLPSQAQGTGVAAIEGHPAWPIDVNGVQTYVPVPVKSAYKYFALTETSVTPRREIVDINKCKRCHDGGIHGDQAIPRLSLHGANRNEELHLCVVCHNPNQTDIPYRTSGAEVSVDFKRMIHSIHGAEKRTTPFVVIGRNGSVNDFSTIKFPGVVSNCLNCHTENNGKGTYELPLDKQVLGSTIVTGSVPGVSIDVNPANDLKISPTAAVCSSCHDSRDAISHMTSRRAGGSFGVLQSAIDSGQLAERCVNCHGPGRDKDIRKAHEIGGSGKEEHDD
ncbi:MAG: hypothetical protein M1133_05190 [Armatimonadetes bacterium]|nr:hypothetical protein [Armatimonadota bacterium]